MTTSSMQVLIVDDDDFALSLLSNVLARMGYRTVTARNGREALEILRRGESRLVITDWEMPVMDGIELSQRIRSEEMAGYVYVIMLTSHNSRTQRMQGLYAGADDFLVKPLEPDELLVCLRTAERILALETRDVALFALAKLAESRDPETGAHLERVQAFARVLARELAQEPRYQGTVDDEFIRLIYQTSPLHDLGKVAIPDTVLLKPDKLTPGEFEVMKTHTELGAKTLEAALDRFPNARFLQMARDIAATHHERYDGAGYPRQLSAQDIPLAGRIVALADAYDAMTSKRVYKTRVSHAEAKARILRDRGSHFDPDVVDAFIRAENQILAIRERLRDDPEDLAAGTPQQQNLGPAVSNRIEILVAEDDPAIRKHVAKVLVGTGHNILTATNGKEALALMTEHRPRIVISDWLMPEMDGLELCRRLRAEGGKTPLHFVMLTANAELKRVIEAFEAGVDDFIAKPFADEELLARLRVALRTVQLHEELSNKNEGSRQLNAQLATINNRLEKLAITDDLTGLFNRRHAMVRLDEQWAAAEQHGQPLSVAVVDIDHFKKINDTRGHDVGDVVLRRIADILRGSVRSADMVCRIGGEELLILLPAQTLEEAAICAERCRAAVAQHLFQCREGNLQVTISVGVAARGPTAANTGDLLKAADEALYAAKRAGRNAVRCAMGIVCVDQLGHQVAVAPAPAIPVPPAPPVPPEAATPPVDLDVAIRRCSGDVSFMQQVLDRFIAQAETILKEIQATCQGQDLEKFRRAAHTLKGTAGFVGAARVAETSMALEQAARAGDVSQKTQQTVMVLDQRVREAIAWLHSNRGAAPAPAEASTPAR